MSSYIDILLERFSEKVCSSYLDKIQFFMDEPENIKIRALAKLVDPRVRSNYRFNTTEENFPAFLDLRFQKYNANQYESYFVCEGPHPKRIESVCNFFDDLLFNSAASVAIQTILVAGDPNEGACFYDYFSKNATFGHYRVQSEQCSKDISSKINLFKLTITDTKTKDRKLFRIYQIKDMPDHGIAKLSTDDIRLLYRIISNAAPNQILFHCAAGLGRSPSLLFAAILFNKFQKIFRGSDEQIIEHITHELNLLRQTRPAAIQRLAQLIQSIQLALQLKKIDWELNPKLYESETKHIPVIGMIGAFDTKGKDYAYLREKIIRLGCIVVTINIGVFETTALFPIDVPTEKILAQTKKILQNLRLQKNRPLAVQAVECGLKLSIKKLHRQYHFAAIVGMGGTNGTGIITSAMRQLPRELPKVCLSTVAQHENWAYTKDANIILIDSFTDVGGLNPISRNQYSMLAGMVVGAAYSYCSLPQHNSEIPLSKKAVGITMFGNTTKCVEYCQEQLEKAGYETLVFHAVGTGGKKMEALVKDGVINGGVLDITTHEIADELCGGLFKAGTKRLEAMGEKYIPHLIIPGCVDMVNLGDYATAFKAFPNRHLHACNPEVTVMRTNVEDNIHIGQYISSKANKAKMQGADVAILIPLKGLSAFEENLDGWSDPAANFTLYKTILETTRDDIPIKLVDAFINDQIFAKEATKAMLKLLRSQDLKWKRPTISSLKKWLALIENQNDQRECAMQ